MKYKYNIFAENLQIKLNLLFITQNIISRALSQHIYIVYNIWLVLFNVRGYRYKYIYLISIAMNKYRDYSGIKILINRNNAEADRALPNHHPFRIKLFILLLFSLEMYGWKFDVAIEAITEIRIVPVIRGGESLKLGEEQFNPREIRRRIPVCNAKSNFY